MTRTLRCTVQYDGTAFAGFQRQPGLVTVQGALETAIGQVVQEQITVIGAGRTDAGVHALGQVIHFRCSSSLPLRRLQRGINAGLGETATITEMVEAPDDFHARYDARSREYHYIVDNGPVLSPLWRQRVHHVRQPLVVDRMATAARALLGTHDFAAFGAPMEHTARGEQAALGRTVRGGTTRTMLAAHCWQVRRFVLFAFIADAFLRHMVRMLVGTLLRIGTGRLGIEAIVQLLHGDCSLFAGPAAPAHGLYLVRVQY